MYLAILRPRVPRRLAIALIFAIHGLIQAGLFSRLAEIQRGVGLTESALGISIVGIPAGVLLGSLLISPVIERRGIRPMLLVGLPFYALGPVLAALAVDVATLFGALFLFGIGLTVTSIAMNVESDRVEAATGGRLINRCHGMWSLGFLTASLIGTGAIALGLSPLMHLVAMLLLWSTAACALARSYAPSPPRAHMRSGPARRLALPTAAVLLIIAFALSGMLLEGSARNWSVIFVRDVFDAADWVAALALPSFIAAQTLGRFLADRWVDRHGPVRVAVAMAAVSLVGLVAVASGLSVAVALAGFFLIGLGISTVYPQAFSAAARLGDRPASENVAAMSTVQTAIGFAYPPLFGLIATDHGIQTSFVAVMPLPLLAMLLARRSLAQKPAREAVGGGAASAMKGPGNTNRSRGTDP
ncbi:MAG: MFS transporter [Alphaproteobacteria bacterium]